MRRPRSRFRRTTVLLLLALRTGQRTVAEEGGLRRPGGLRRGSVGPPPSNGRLPSEGGAGGRPASGAGRGPRWCAYLLLEVRSCRFGLAAGTSDLLGGTRGFRPHLPHPRLIAQQTSA